MAPLAASAGSQAVKLSHHRQLKIVQSHRMELRATLPEIDGIVLARDARAQLEHRGDS